MPSSAQSPSRQPAVDAAAAPPAASGEPAVCARGLGKVYAGGLVAVDELDLTVRPGEIFGLLGPNGAGKTTTVGMLTTRVVPTRGTAQVAGVDVVAEPARAKQQFGVVSQGTTLDPSLTVAENLYFHARYFGASRRQARTAADAWLAAFRLAPKADAEVAALSGGMARRLMLARALLHRPAVVFLDEPTAGLDPQSRLALWELIDALHAAGQTVVLTTHYMEEADRFCDRVAIMDHGAILALDTPARLKESAPAAVTVTVAADGDLNQLAGRLATIDGAAGVRVADGRVRLQLAGCDDAVGTVAAAAAAGGFVLTDVSVSETTLESVFLGLTGEELRE